MSIVLPAPVAVETFVFTESKPYKGSCFVKVYNVDLNDAPFAMVARFNKAHGDNWTVGFANSLDGGTFDTFEAAAAFVQSR